MKRSFYALCFLLCLLGFARVGWANDVSKSVAKAYAPPTMPSSYIVDRDGRVRRVHAGFKSADAKELEREVQQLLK